MFRSLVGSNISSSTIGDTSNRRKRATCRTRFGILSIASLILIIIGYIIVVFVSNLGVKEQKISPNFPNSTETPKTSNPTSTAEPTTEGTTLDPVVWWDHYQNRTEAAKQWDSCGQIHPSFGKPTPTFNRSPMHRGQYPWLVTFVKVLKRGRGSEGTVIDLGELAGCSGALIGNGRYVLTTAACCDTMMEGAISRYHAVMGIIDVIKMKYWPTTTDFQFRHAVQSCTLHPNYDKRKESEYIWDRVDDVSIVKLEQAFQQLPAVNTICLPLDSQVRLGVTYSVAGAVTSGSNENILNTWMTVIGGNKEFNCRLLTSFNPYQYAVYWLTACTCVDSECKQRRKQNPMACAGDYGATLVRSFPDPINATIDRYYLFGLAANSWNFNTFGQDEDTRTAGCERRTHTLYTNVASNLNFILDYLKDND